MSVTYTIENLISAESTGIVKGVEFTASKTDGNYQAKKLCSVELDSPVGTPIPYNDLTPEIVTAWVDSKLSAQQKEMIEHTLDFIINRIKNPPEKDVAGLPWKAQ